MVRLIGRVELRGCAYGIVGALMMLSPGGLVYAEVVEESFGATFSDPSRPGLVKVRAIQGDVVVRGYSGVEVLVEAKGREGFRGGEEEMAGTGVRVREEENVVYVSAGSETRPDSRPNASGAADAGQL